MTPERMEEEIRKLDERHPKRKLTSAVKVKPFDRIGFIENGKTRFKIVGAANSDIDAASNKVIAYDPDGRNPETLSMGSGNYWVWETTNPNFSKDEKDEVIDSSSDVDVKTLNRRNKKSKDDLDDSDYLNSLGEHDMHPRDRMSREHDFDDHDFEDHELDSDLDTDLDTEVCDPSEEVCDDEYSEHPYVRDRRRSMHDVEDRSHLDSQLDMHPRHRRAFSRNENRSNRSSRISSNRLGREVDAFLTEMGTDAKELGLDKKPEPDVEKNKYVLDKPGGNPVKTDAMASDYLQSGGSTLAKDEVKTHGCTDSGKQDSASLLPTATRHMESSPRVKRDVSKALGLVERGADVESLAKAILLGGK